MNSGTAALLEQQRAFWERRWSVADVEVAGDVDATRTLRAGLFQLTGSSLRRGEAAVQRLWARAHVGGMRVVNGGTAGSRGPFG